MAKRTFGEIAGDAIKDAPVRGADDPAPVGKHIAKVVARKLSRTNAGDKVRLSVKFSVDTGPETGKTSWASHSYDPANATNVRILLSWCKAFGFDGAKEMAALDPDDGDAVMGFVHDRADGARCQITVVSGRNGNEVKYVDPVPGDAKPPRAKTTAASMAKVAGAPKAPAPTAPKTRPAI